MSTIALQYKARQLAIKKALASKEQAAQVEADTIQQTAEDYENFQILCDAMETDLKKLSGKPQLERNKIREKELIPKYLKAMDDYFINGDEYRNPVLVELVIMLLDCGINNRDLMAQGVEMALIAIDQKQPMAKRFKSNLPTFVADQVFTWANAEIARDQDPEPEFSDVFNAMINDGWPVPREVLSKYYKLFGDIFHASGELEKSLNAFLQASTIDPAGAKVKTKIDMIRKKLEKKSESADSQDTGDDD